MRNKKIQRLLYKSLDTPLSAEESKTLNNELQNSVELREQHFQILNIRKAIGENADTSFKILFEERLFDKLNKLPNRKPLFNVGVDSLTTSFRKIAFSAIIILILLISYNLKSGNKYSKFWY